MISANPEARSAWPTVQLSEVAEHCLGKMLDAQKNKGRPLPYLRNPNVRWFEIDTTDLMTMPFEPHEDDRYGLREGDVVVCEGGEAGRAAIWDGRLPNMKFQKAIHRVRPGPKLDARFLVYRLMTDYQSGRLADYYTGATIKHLTGQDLARYRFPLPPLPEQRRIAKVLDQAEALRAKRRAALAQLDTLTQNIFVNMFGDPATNPKRWPITHVGELAQQIRGVTYAKEDASVEAKAGYLPVLRAGNIQNHEIVLEDLVYVPDERVSNSQRLRRHDILIVASSGSLNVVGKAARIEADLEAGFGAFCKVLRPHKGIDPDYFAAFFGSQHYRKRVSALAAGININNLRGEHLDGFPIPVPPKEVQKNFAMKVRAARGVRAQHRASLSELDALFASIQHRAFRGEL